MMTRCSRTCLGITTGAMGCIVAFVTGCSGGGSAARQTPTVEGTRVANLSDLVAGECVEGIPPPDQLKQVALSIVDCGGNAWDVRVLAILGTGSDVCPADTNQFEQLPGFAPAFVPKTLCLQRRIP
jgi:hypothetical protein